MGRQKRIPSGTAALRRLPAVSALLDHPRAAALIEGHGRALIMDLVRSELERCRSAIASRGAADATEPAPFDQDAFFEAVARQAEELLSPRPRVVINATGVVIHTNLGRAALAPQAAQQLAETACGYVDLEYDLGTGGRGSRQDALTPLMQRLFPGWGFAVFNNNAAAVLIALRALAADREVPISRGELVEIGGSFRVPDILALSGARLREVGTTNRTRPSDYEAALGAETGALLKVHPSNFHIVGFTESVSVADLAAIARRAAVPLIVDWGSGSLVDLDAFGLSDEPPARALLEQGADVLTFSGDKLLGGPQSGFVVGRPDLVDRIRRDPLARVCRIDRFLLGALNRTLAAHVRGRALEEVPVLRMLALSAEQIGARAAAWRDELSRRLEREPAADRPVLEVVGGVSRSGGGSSPSGERPTRLLAVSLPGRDARHLELALREGMPPVLGRLHEGRLLLDPRTVLVEQEPILFERLIAALFVLSGKVRD